MISADGHDHLKHVLVSYKFGLRPLGVGGVLEVLMQVKLRGLHHNLKFIYIELDFLHCSFR